MKFFVTFVILILTTGVSSELTTLAKQDIETLSSPEFKGRGYYHDGHLKAAEFITQELVDIGVQRIKRKYNQTFKVSVNSIIDEPSLIFDGDSLILGQEFLPNSITGSGVIERTSKIVYLENGIYAPDNNINHFWGKETEIPGSIVIIGKSGELRTAIPESFGQ